MVKTNYNKLDGRIHPLDERRRRLKLPYALQKKPDRRKTVEENSSILFLMGVDLMHVGGTCRLGTSRRHVLSLAHHRIDTIGGLH